MTWHSQGKVEWIGLRSSRDQPMNEVASVEVDADHGLVDDRGGAEHRRVTLFELEYLDTIAKFLGLERVLPHQTRRNIGVSGINLHGAIDQQISIGSSVLKITGDCAPCKRMETTVGPGAQLAMVGLAGVTASVVKPGKIQVGDALNVIT